MALAFIAGAQPAAAQSQLPPAAEPGTLQRDFITREQQSLPATKKVPLLPQVLAPLGAEKLELTLKTINLVGNSVFSSAELAELYTPYLGQTLTLAEVYGIAALITQKYQEAGYVLSVANLPPQEIADGQVTIQITEAYVADLHITGMNLSSRLLEQFRTRATATKPLHKATLEEILLLLGNLPGASVTPVLIPGGAPGAVKLEVAMQVKPHSLSAGLNNRGSRFTGPFRQNMSLTLYQLPHFASLKIAEETALPLDELKNLDLAYTLPLDAYGNSLELGYTASRSEPGYTLNSLDVMSESDTFRLRWQTPLWLTASQDTRFQLTFEHTNAASTILSAPNSDDRLRVLEAALTTNQQHASGSQTAGRLALRQGLNVMGASEPGRPFLSRLNGRSDFTSLKLDLQHWQPLAPRWGLQAGLTGQYAAAQLLASEEFSWGGSNFGRAYDTAIFTGDHGLGGSLELNYLLPSRNQNNHQLYAFTDLGAAWKIDNNAANNRQSGLSAGFGLRSFFGNHFSTSIEFAKPLTKPSNHTSLNGNDPRLFVGSKLAY